MVKSVLRVWDDAIIPRIESKSPDKYISSDRYIQRPTLDRLAAMCNVLEHFSEFTKLSGEKEFPAIAHVPRWLVELNNNLAAAGSDTMDMVRFKGLLLDSLSKR
jgi:hypothetical protein